MKLDVAAAIQARRRYVVMFFPEIGHGPWLPLHGEATVLERGRALMELQDQWLREILDLLGSLGRLEHTVVVVTADHGVRTKAEDPSLPVGWISDYMFRVPLIVYAPQTLTSTTAIPQPTSHIDVAPTILSLLGKQDAVASMQGIPIWQRSRRDRIYLLAFDYGGAEGFVEDGRYYMRQEMSGAVYASDRFTFTDANQVPAGEPGTRFVTDGLTRLDALQQTLVSQTIAQAHR
jgi:arylsulfatase A-like enzyme